jgi:hypothetical protein
MSRKPKTELEVLLKAIVEGGDVDSIQPDNTLNYWLKELAKKGVGGGGAAKKAYLALAESGGHEHYGAYADIDENNKVSGITIFSSAFGLAEMLVKDLSNGVQCFFVTDSNSPYYSVDFNKNGDISNEEVKSSIEDIVGFIEQALSLEIPEDNSNDASKTYNSVPTVEGLTQNRYNGTDNFFVSLRNVYVGKSSTTDINEIDENKSFVGFTSNTRDYTILYQAQR